MRIVCSNCVYIRSNLTREHIFQVYALKSHNFALRMALYKKSVSIVVYDDIFKHLWLVCDHYFSIIKPCIFKQKRVLLEILCLPYLVLL